MTPDRVNALLAFLTPEEREEHRQRQRRDRFKKPVLYRLAAFGAWWIVMSSAVFTLHGCAPMREWTREQNLLECIKGAQNERVAGWCSVYWGRPESEEQ